MARLARANAAAEALGFPHSAARAAADVASGADLNAAAIDTFMRHGAVRSSDDARRVVRLMLLRGMLVELRNVGTGGADTPLRELLVSSTGPLVGLGRVAAFLDVPLLVPEVRLKPHVFSSSSSRPTRSPCLVSSHADAISFLLSHLYRLCR